jgi:hypothetical protein
MKYLRMVSMLAVAGGFLLAAADGPGETPSGKGGADRSAPERVSAIPPVLRNFEPADTGIVVLPGPATTAPAPPPAPAKPVLAKVVIASNTVPRPDPDRPILRRAPRPIFPDEFEKDSAAFCHKRIGQWTADQARGLFGAPKSQRAAYDDRESVNGEILAFSDPTGRYKQIELDFESDTGALRTVFVYPWKMTWQECRRAFGVNVTATEANKGRMFYSYLNRRLDVLVDHAGQVISLGMY